MICWLRRSWLLPVVFLSADDTGPGSCRGAEANGGGGGPARGKPASASDSQGGHDPDDGERWRSRHSLVRAPTATPGHWWQVDLGKPEDLSGCRILWESSAGYGYKVEGSADGTTWKTLADATRADVHDQERLHSFAASGVRYVRVNVTGLEPGHWASFFECAVLGTQRSRPHQQPHPQPGPGPGLSGRRRRRIGSWPGSRCRRGSRSRSSPRRPRSTIPPA